MSNASFNPYDEDLNWFFGNISRDKSIEILTNENDIGTFLIRNSTTIPGDVVLCVRENNKVSHYIIHKIMHNNEIRYRIGDQTFIDIPSLLNFYSHHLLETSPLIKPAKKKLIKVKAKFDFRINDPEDLAFDKDEILIVLSKNEEKWWFAKNERNQRGLIPSTYVEELIEDDSENQIAPNSISTSQPEAQQENYRTPDIQRNLPAKARVIKSRIPNAYDETALKLEVDDIITVTKLNITGQFEGELNGKVGHFPFNYVEFID